MIEKFNMGLVKQHQLGKFRHYAPAETPATIRMVLLDEAAEYVRHTKKIPDDKQCITYITKEGKVAVLTMETPKKRLLLRKAEQELFRNGDNTPLDELRQRYGFIPRPINVLKKYVDYGYMKSQDVEHLYHNEPVAFKISDKKEDFERAYSLQLNEKDVLIDGFNGYSCMSEEPKVGTFYYYFGAYMLIFYKCGTTEMVGRMVLWPWKNELHVHKGYVKSKYQFAAAAVRDKLIADGKITDKRLPADFHISLQRMGNKSPENIYNNICDQCCVPYIDDDLMLNDDKTELSYDGSYECRETDMVTLENYGTNCCYECGDEIYDSNDEVWIDGHVYCPNCAKYCSCCEEWCTPDCDGEEVGCNWVCQDCLDEHYFSCDNCEGYCHNDDKIEVLDEDGYWQDFCEGCFDDNNGKTCECGNKFIPKYESQTLCPHCLEEQENEEE